MVEAYMSGPDHIATEVQKLSTKSRSLERTNPVSVKNGEMRGPNEDKNVGASTADLSSLRSELYQRRSSECAIGATKTRTFLPFDFVLSFPRTAEARYKSGSLPDTNNRIESVTDGGAAVPSVSTSLTV